MASSHITVRGAAALQVDATEVEARLRIRKDDSGPVWSREALKTFLEKHNVVTGFTDASLDGALDQVAEANDPEPTVTVAQGSPPEEPQRERLEMEDLPIAPELSHTAEKLLAAAGPPEISVTRTRSVERAKVVEKRRLLPFLPRKRETVTVKEKESTIEHIHADPTVESSGFAEEGRKVATVTPPAPGRPGVSVYATPLQPTEPGDPHVYAGSGVVRRHNELYAERSGFLRCGPNWVDIIPFSDHEWHIGTSRDQATYLLTFHPGHGTADPPAGSDVLDAAATAGYVTERLLSAEEIFSLIDKALRSGTSLVDAPITRSQDAAFRIDVTEDKLKAVLTVRKGTGSGRALVLRELGSAIQNSGLKRLDLKQIRHDIMDFYNSTRVELTGYVLAEGKAPIPGPKRELAWNVDFLAEKELRQLQPASVDEEEPGEPFPQKRVQLMAYVEEQQQIASIPPAEPGESGIDVYGQSIPAEPQPEPAVQFSAGVTRRNNTIVATRTGLLECTTLDETCHMRVRPHRDATISVRLSDDRMTAFFTLTPGEGSGEAITETAVRAAIADAGVISGIDEAAVQNAIADAAEGVPVEAVPFAAGTPPQHQDSPRVEYLTRMASGAPFRVRDDGSIDHRNQDLLTTVAAGERIARVIPPEQAPHDGEDVTGKHIPAQRVSGKPLSAGSNVRSEAADGAEVLVSEIAGELSIEQQVVSVVPRRSVNGDVDLSTGNVKFPGSVSVSGNVRRGFYVVAQGSINIGEAVEGALLSADGDVIIQHGIKGGGKGVVRSKRNIRAAFAERCTLLSVGDVALKNSCIHSSVKCNGRLSVQGQNGSIVGGEIRVRHGLSVTNLGSRSGTQTWVFFGQDYLVADQLEREQHAIEKLKAHISELDTAMRKREKAGDAIELERLRKEKKKGLHIMEKRSLRLFSLREKFERHFESYVDVLGTIYPGVIIESHRRRHEFRQEKSRIRIYFDLDSGHIQEEPLISSAEEQSAQ